MMCAVSATIDYMKTWQPQPTQWTWDQYRVFRRMIEAAKEADKKTNQPDCEMDDKVDWLKKIEDRLTKIEERLK